LLEQLQDRIYRLIYALLKFGGSIKDEMLDWLAGCLHANAGTAWQGWHTSYHFRIFKQTCSFKQ